MATNPTGTSDDDSIVFGDLNSYAQEDPVQTLLGDGYVDLVAQAAALGTGGSSVDPYNYAFPVDLDTASQAQTYGTLDYVLATETLAQQMIGAGVWHINADEATVNDYDENFTGLDPFDGSTPYRSSDHDPILIGLDLDGGIAVT